MMDRPGRVRAGSRGRALALVLLVLATALLSGCNQVQVAEDLTQAQATEIVATLNQSGISATAERESGGRGRFAVQVRKSQYVDAVQLLHERGLPSEARPSFRELIASRGLVPDSREVEALRLDRALAAEIEEALEVDPSVASARVIVRLNSLPIELSGDNSQAGVSATLRIRPGGSVQEQSVRDTISRAIPGVDPSKIHVSAHTAEGILGLEGSEGVERGVGGQVARVPLTDFLWIWRVPESDYNGLALGLLLGILVVFGLGTVVGSTLSSYRQARSAQAETPGTFGAARRLPPGNREARGRTELPEPPGGGEGGN